MSAFSFVLKQEQSYISVLACRHRVEGQVYDYDTEEIICSDCGMVLGQIRYSPLEHFRWLWGLKNEK